MRNWLSLQSSLNVCPGTKERASHAQLHGWWKSGTKHNLVSSQHYCWLSSVVITFSDIWFCRRYKDGFEVLTAPSNPKSHRVILPTGSLFFLRVMQNKKEEVSWKMRRKRCVYVFVYVFMLSRRRMWVECLCFCLCFCVIKKKGVSWVFMFLFMFLCYQEEGCESENEEDDSAKDVFMFSCQAWTLFISVWCKNWWWYASCCMYSNYHSWDNHMTIIHDGKKERKNSHILLLEKIKDFVSTSVVLDILILMLLWTFYRCLYIWTILCNA